MRPLIARFAEMMSAKLEQEQPTKGDLWKVLGPWELLRLLDSERSELQVALRQWSSESYMGAPGNEQKAADEHVIAECVDMAIFAMFIAAIVGALEHEEAVTDRPADSGV